MIYLPCDDTRYLESCLWLFYASFECGTGVITTVTTPEYVDTNWRFLQMRFNGEPMLFTMHFIPMNDLPH